MQENHFDFFHSVRRIAILEECDVRLFADEGSKESQAYVDIQYNLY